MSDDLIEQYKKLNQDVAKLEGALEAIRTQRGVVAGQLLARDGKGRGYDLGDGVEQIVCSTKVGTHYLVARNKWQKPGRPIKPPSVKPPKEPKQAKPAKAALAPKVPKPVVKRAIVNGQVVEVLAKPASVPPPPTPEPSVQEAIPEAALAAVEPVVETSVAPEAPAPAAEAAPPRVVETPPAVAPVVAPEPSPVEVDPLDAALAALDL